MIIQLEFNEWSENFIQIGIAQSVIFGDLDFLLFFYDWQFLYNLFHFIVCFLLYFKSSSEAPINFDVNPNIYYLAVPSIPPHFVLFPIRRNRKHFHFKRKKQNVIWNSIFSFVLPFSILVHLNQRLFFQFSFVLLVSIWIETDRTARERNRIFKENFTRGFPPCIYTYIEDVCHTNCVMCFKCINLSFIQLFICF